MVIDFIVIGIFVLSTIMGKRQGFLESVLKLGSLVASLICGVMFTQSLTDIVYMTSVDESLIERFTPFEVKGVFDLTELIPGSIGETVRVLTQGALATTVIKFTDLIITTACFAVIVIVVCLLFKFLRRKLKLSKRKKGVIGRVDDSVGLLLGALRGVILVMLFLAFMLPVAGIWAPERINELSELLNHSYLAGTLYDINPLLKIMY